MNPLSPGFVSARQAQTPIVLSLDIGSSSARAALFDAGGRQIEGCCHQMEIDAACRIDGAAELNLLALLDRCFACLDAIHNRAAALGLTVSAVAVSTLTGNLLGLDASGTPATSLHTYANTGAGGMIRRLKKDLDEAGVHQRTGCPFHSSYWPALFLWLADTRPDQYRRVRTWTTLGQFLAGVLQEEPPPLSYSVASWSGLFNRHRKAWDRELVQYLNLAPECLPPLTGSVGRPGLSKAYARLWPGFRKAVWYPAVADGAAANLGTGCLGPDRISLTIGTTSAVRVGLPENPDPIPSGLWCYRVDEIRSLVGGALNEGGNFHARLRELFLVRDARVVERRLAGSRPDGHGLTLLPTFLGERSPGWRSDLRSGAYGFSAHTTAIDLLQAGMEAVGYRLAVILSRLQDFTDADGLMVACGGALRESPVWRRMIADILERPVALFLGPEASLRGAALLALEALGEMPNAAAAPDLTGEAIYPNPRTQAVYRKARIRHELFYKKMVELQTEMNGQAG